MHGAVELAEGSGKNAFGATLADAEPRGNLGIAHPPARTHDEDLTLKRREGRRRALDPLGFVRWPGRRFPGAHVTDA